MIRLSFACNDEHGKFTGKFDAIEFGVELDCAVWLTGPKRRIKLHRFRHGLSNTIVTRTHGPVYAITIGGIPYRVDNYSSHVGNLIWDACSVSVADARELLTWLLSTGHVVEEHADEGPLADLLVNREARS